MVLTNSSPSKSESNNELDSRKPFTIPKTSIANKDFLITEKSNSRNVIDLFDEIKSCSLETQFNFSQEQWSSCDSIRNPKLQRSYNEKRAEMKKIQEPNERLAFHLVFDRDQAAKVANDGLCCDQLSFSTEQFLANPKEGIHLCRRPDVLLLWANRRGLKKFGLLVCKILLAKGFPTIPTEGNKQFSAQLHYDHHFPKISMTIGEKNDLDKLFGKSLIFCYEHEVYQTVSRPKQVLPISVVWYQLKENFRFESSLIEKPLKNSSQRKIVNAPNVFRENERKSTMNNQMSGSSPQKNVETNSTKSIPLETNNSQVDPRGKTSVAKKIHLAMPKKISGKQSSTNFPMIPFFDRASNEANLLKSAKIKPFSVEVIDFFDLAQRTSSKETFIDLEDPQNSSILEKLQSRERKVRKAKRLRSDESNSKNEEKNKKIRRDDFKIHFEKGRTALKSRTLKNDYQSNFSDEILDFFSNEYRQENRLHVKRILAELAGIFIEKYPPKQNDGQLEVHQTQKERRNSASTNFEVVAMDIETVSDRDDRFETLESKENQKCDNETENKPKFVLETFSMPSRVVSNHENQQSNENKTNFENGSKDRDERRSNFENSIVLCQLQTNNEEQKRSSVELASAHSNKIDSPFFSNSNTRQCISCSPVKTPGSPSNFQRQTPNRSNEKNRNVVRRSRFSSSNQQKSDLTPWSSTDRSNFSMKYHSNNRTYPQMQSRVEDNIPSLMETRIDPSLFYNDQAVNFLSYQEPSTAHIPPLMSTVPKMEFSRSVPYSNKPSETIERLQMFLKNRP